MKNILILSALGFLSACTSVSPEQVENMSAAQRESTFQFEKRSTQELCGAYTNPQIPIGQATKTQIAETLKSRGVSECFDKMNKLVMLP